MIGINVFGRKNAMAGIALGTSTFSHRNRNQDPCRTVAGATRTMLLGRSAYRHPTRQALGAGMTSGTVRRQTNQTTVILAGVNRRKIAVTGRAATATSMTRC